MTIDTERLKTDAAYWDECGAPEDATHYCAAKKEWINGHCHSIDVCCIPRPQAPEAEWVDGLPPVGCECEFMTKTWRVGRVVCYVDGRHGKQGVVQFNDDWQCFSPEDVPGRVRPIPTKAQREREWLMSIVACGLLSDDGKEANRIVDGILSLYNLEPKP